MVSRNGRQLEVDGKWFRRDGERLSLRAVTYGPFPEPIPDAVAEMAKVKEAGFHAIRVYEEPTDALLDAAFGCGVMVMVGVSWAWHSVFLGEPQDEVHFTVAKEKLRRGLLSWGRHPAVVAVYVANEIAPDLARWMGVAQVKRAIEQLIDVVHDEAPGLLAAYSSYPCSEFLEPSNADFTALNVYLEQRESFAKYLPRLHHLAGDRPVMISEFGMDTLRAGEEQQAEVLRWFYGECMRAGIAGTTWFSWSDRWFAGGEVVQDWRFGLCREDGSGKRALQHVSELVSPLHTWPKMSVIVCVYNGDERIGRALDSLARLEYPDVECIVVDDGSTDRTREVVLRYSFVRLIECGHGGLSVARNAGAAAATGEILVYMDDDCEADPQWLHWLAQAYEDHGWDACGGPNLPPFPEGEDEAVVASAPGAPSHVMLDDVTAEHLPGCNLSVKKSVFDAVGGFREAYWVAGDDVDFCWRLRDAGYLLGFHGGAFVWHRRRTTLWRYFKQQWGYGKAEALLMRDHPAKFSRDGSARWEGCVYLGGAVGGDSGSVIYHGPAALAGYQQVQVNMMPQRELPRGFQTWRCVAKLKLARCVQPRLRRWARWWYGRSLRAGLLPLRGPKIRLAGWDTRPVRELRQVVPIHISRELLINELVEKGWALGADADAWDLHKGKAVLMVALETYDSKWRGVRLRMAGVGAGERDHIEKWLRALC